MIRDLVVDMGMFYKQYEKIKPYLLNDTPRLQLSVFSLLKIGISWMGCTNVFYVHVAPLPVHRFGGIQTNLLALPACCKRIDS